MKQVREEGWPYAGHFPPAILSTAKDTHFFYESGGLQGPRQLELRYTLPPDELAAVVRQFAGQAIPADSTKTYPWVRPIPTAFQKLVLEAAQDKHGTSGFGRGVAVQPGTGEVIYWAEEWH